MISFSKKNYMVNNLYFIIQARTGSSRLPNKVTLPFYKDQSILEIIIQRLKKNFQNYPIIVATSVLPEDMRIKQIADNCKVFSYLGDEKNVLKRFIDAATFFNATSVVRICADNPFLDMTLLKEIIENASDKVDYVTHEVLGIPSMRTHYGLWAEYVKTEALLKINQATEDCLYKEHVTNYIYTYPEKFIIKYLNADYIAKKLNNIRLTVDTKVDFELASYIFHNIYEKNENFDYNDIEFFFESNFSNIAHILKRMANEISNNNK